MNYTTAIEWLHSLGRVASQPGPGRMAPLLAALGNPQGRLRFVHVVGTNGKGSAVVMAASILYEAGYKVGANISPYVLEYTERFQINGINATRAQVADALTAVRQAAETLPEPPIEFMATTAAAFLLFQQAGCDIVCLEAGIGGKSDDTNIIENTLVADVMRIGYDHTELLGDTLAQIAYEKCGVFKNGCDVVSYPAQPPKAMEIIRQQAEAKGCKLIVPNPEDIYFYQCAPFENRINYGGYDLTIPFVGTHQALNAAVAVETALSLWRQGYAIEDEHIINGISKARLPARIEVAGRSPLILMDGAHNEDSASALADTLRRQELAGLTAVIGVLRDKQAEDMLRMLSPFINKVFTVTPDSPRAMPAEELAKLAEKYVRYTRACGTVEQAVHAALRDPGEGLLICGSFYLIHAAKRALSS